MSYRKVVKAFMINSNTKSPLIIKNILSSKDFNELQQYVKNLDKSSVGHSDQFSRYEFGGSDLLNMLHKNLLSVAKEFFENKNIVPSFNFGSWYYGDASLEKHKDVNACTYTIDLCVYQTTPWDLYVEGIPYTLNENEALLYYGESQKHWREDFPDGEGNIVCNVFFFYVEPDHWFFSEPKEKHEKIKQKLYIEKNLVV
jgi:hypothetical protein